MASAKKASAEAQPRPAEKGEDEKDFECLVEINESLDDKTQTAFDEFKRAKMLGFACAAGYIAGLVAGRRGK